MVKEALLKQLNFSIPKVSVIIPVYNAEEYIEKCIISLLHQTLKEIEFIFVDDGSTDNSANIIKQFAKEDDRIKLILQTNSNAGEARNKGLMKAKGEFVHFLDSDDWVDIETYEKLYKKIKKEDVDFIKFKSFSFDNQNNTVTQKYFTDMGAIPKGLFNKKITPSEYYNILSDVSDAPWSGIYKRGFLKDNDIFFDSLKCANDTGFFFRCLFSANSLYLWDERFVYYRINNSKSLISSRAYNFECQISLYDIIINIVKSKETHIVDYIRKRTVRSIFYRFNLCRDQVEGRYKEKLLSQMRSFVDRIDYSDIPYEYLPVCEELISKTEISIILPIYNVEKYLERCLNSIKRQTLQKFELIIVDDKSTDSSLKIAQDFAKTDPRVTVYANSSNLGQGRSRNIGISKAKGKYIAFIDGDDFISDDFLQGLHCVALKNDSDIVSTSCVQRYPSLSIKQTGHSIGEIKSFSDKASIILATGIIWNKIYRRIFLLHEKILFPEISSYGEDNYFTALTIIKAKRIDAINTATYFYQENPESTTSYKKYDKVRFLIDSYKLTLNRLMSDKNVDIRYEHVLLNRAKKDCLLAYCNLQKFERDRFKKYYQNTLSKNIDDFFDFDDVIITLTSYPARISFVIQSLRSLLNQDIYFEKIILFLAKEQFPSLEKDLPLDIVKLIGPKFTIEWCEDIRSYKKYIPAIRKYNDKVIVTADDDLLYPSFWLRNLVKARASNPNVIHAMRTHIITFKGNKMQSYNKWKKENDCDVTGYCVFPTTGAGVIFNPSQLHVEVLSESKFNSLAPDADDIWFWAMAINNGVKIHAIQPGYLKLNYIDGSQEVGTLFEKNKLSTGNDLKLMNVLKSYPQMIPIIKSDVNLLKRKRFYLIIKNPLRKINRGNVIAISLFGFELCSKVKSNSCYKFKVFRLSLFKKIVNKNVSEYYVLGMKIFRKKM